jgi:hypothetical protein
VFVKKFVAGCAFACLLALVPSPLALAQVSPVPPPENPAEGEEGPGVRPFDYTKVAAPPPLPKVVDVRQLGESGGFIGASAWFGRGKPYFDRGENNTSVYPANVRLLGGHKFDQGFELGVAVSHHDSLRFSYQTMQASGGDKLDKHVQLWTELYPGGNWLDRNYRMKSFKFTLDYLAWPNPVKSSKFRLKTLWSMQYVNVHTGFDAPYASRLDSTGNLLFNSDGTVVGYNTQGSLDSWSPVVGLETQYWAAKRLRLEATAEGFAFPHRSATWNADASAGLRIGRYELRLGVKAFHFRTTPKVEFWVRGTVIGPFIGLRMYSN